MSLALASPLAAQAQDRVLRHAGVNLAGAEFNSSKKPGVLFKDYVYPAEADFAYFAGKGMNTVRLPFLWERLQPQAEGPLDAAQLGQLRTAVARARKHGLAVVLDVHNYARYNGRTLGTAEAPVAALVDLWRRLADEFGQQQDVVFGLMNEPNGIDAAAWTAAAQAALEAIRATGARNLVLVPGTAYSGAHSWQSSWYGGASNAQALRSLRDPAGNVAIEVHQYLDRDFSGTSPDCVSERIGADKLAGFTRWLRETGQRGFLGEFAASSQPACMAALRGMLEHIQDNSDVWLGWTYWAAGSWWNASYPFNVHPDKDGNDKPQMAVLEEMARRASGATP